MFWSKNKPSCVMVEMGTNSQKSMLVEVNNGKGLLKKVYINQKLGDKQFGLNNSYLTPLEWRFDGIPLVYVNAASAETTRSMLMHGHDTSGVNEYFENVNKVFEFESAPIYLEKILTLFQSGYYILTKKYSCPTDGMNRFFWDIDNKVNGHEATYLGIYSENEGMTCYYHFAETYLFPSEYSYKYNQERVNYYIEYYKKHNQMPYTITIALPGCISLIIDGHHKAAACAQLGIKVPTIEISEVYASLLNNKKGHYIYFEGNPVKVKENNVRNYSKREETLPIPFYSTSLNTKAWKDYTNMSSKYPSLLESKLNSLLDNPLVDDAYIKQSLNTGDIDKLMYLVILLDRIKYSDYNNFLISVLKKNLNNYGLNKLSFEKLVYQDIKNDEIEALLIEVLVDLPDNSGIRDIILGYW